MNIRTRDVLALLALVFLMRKAWRDDPTDSVGALMQLAFYIPHDQHSEDNARLMRPVGPCLLDVDGDGISEAMVVLERRVHRTDATDDGRPNQRQDAYRWKLLDLRPMQRKKPPRAIAAPFQPKKLLQSDDMTTFQALVNQTVKQPFPKPLTMITGHVQVKSKKQKASRKEKVVETDDSRRPRTMDEKEADVNERTRHYFCGTDWHDAASKCSTPCPSGSVSECPPGERCFADTPCDYYERLNSPEDDASFQETSSARRTNEERKLEEEETGWTWWFGKTHKEAGGPRKIHVTQAGGLPSVFTFWNNGLVTMHSLTGDVESKDGDQRRQPLELKLMWQVHTLPNTHVTVHWEEYAIHFIDAISADNGNGSLIVSAMIYHEPDRDEDGWSTSYVVRINAATGQMEWSSYADLEEDAALASLLPLASLTRGSQSYARRRSKIPNLHPQTIKREIQRGGGRIDCMHSFRRSILTTDALPYLHWSSDYASIRTVHFDHQHPQRQSLPNAKMQNNANSGANNKAVGMPSKAAMGKKESGAAAALSKTKSWWSSTASRRHSHSRHHLFHHPRHGSHHSSHPQYGRPNVVVTHNLNGLQVRSLKNGRPLCHMSLLPERLYADLNHDGVLDSVQIATGDYDNVDDEVDTEELDDTVRWVTGLIQRVSKMSADVARKETSTTFHKNNMKDRARTSLCHIMALSGLPPKEELFSGYLCGSHRHDVVYLDPLAQDFVQQHANRHVSSSQVEASPPLLVEPYLGGANNPKGWDVVVAVSGGYVHRFRGTSGRRIWVHRPKRQEKKDSNDNSQVEFPVWQDDSLAVLARIDTPVTVASMRPILLSGENRVILLDARSGETLVDTPFPQPVMFRPMLMDLNGDATTDLLVTTTDAYWGYQVKVFPNGTTPVLFRICLGFLVAGLMLAYVRNQMQAKPGKRATDM